MRFPDVISLLRFCLRLHLFESVLIEMASGHEELSIPPLCRNFDFFFLSHHQLCICLIERCRSAFAYVYLNENISDEMISCSEESLLSVYFLVAIVVFSLILLGFGRFDTVRSFCWPFVGSVLSSVMHLFNRTLSLRFRLRVFARG